MTKAPESHAPGTNAFGLRLTDSPPNVAQGQLDGLACHNLSHIQLA